MYVKESGNQTNTGWVAYLGGVQSFRYVADGTETNPFTVALPATRASASYNVQVTMGGPSANAIKSVRPLVSTFTTTEFDLELGAPIENGDIFMITVSDLT
jgi:hypothetical protein